MKWYLWKFWRFAWTGHTVESYRMYGTDEDGEWVRIFDGLWWLRTRRN